jgi:uncharacterized protein (TIGR00255 family)
MTGYGRGECAERGFKITVEISSVNRKQAEIALNLPRELEILEAQIRDEINQSLSRGRLTVRIALHRADSADSAQAHVNVPVAKAYLKQIKQLAADLGLRDEITLDLLMRAPGVFEPVDELSEPEDLWPCVLKALRQSLDALLKMRAKEGAHLSSDLSARMKLIRQSVKRIEKQAPLVAERFREQLRERIRSAGLELPAVDDERLIKEIVYFVDRSDITEEITRLKSHFGQFDDCVKSQEPVGRTLDFLSQEMNREVNTVGSKANDAIISREVVSLKAELERFREQSQNVE